MPVKIERTFDEFGEVVKRKLRIKQRQGYSGWEYGYFNPDVRQQLEENLRDGDWVDVAACAMILWNLERMAGE